MKESREQYWCIAIDDKYTFHFFVKIALFYPLSNAYDVMLCYCYVQPGSGQVLII